MHNPTRRLLWDSTPFSCVFCRVRYLGITSVFKASGLHTSTVAGDQWVAASSGRSRLQYPAGSRLKKTGGDRLHLLLRRSVLTSSRSTATASSRSDISWIQHSRPEPSGLLSALDVSSRSRFPPGSISTATRIYLLWASQRRCLSSMPTLRHEYATSQFVDPSATTAAPSETLPPTASGISDLRHPTPKDEVEEEDPRDLFWTMFPKAEAPEELERIAAQRVQKHSRGNKAEDLLKKSLYLRKPAAEWWGQYEDLSQRWRSLKDPVQSLQASSSIGGADFVQMIESLKLCTTTAGKATPVGANRGHTQENDRTRKLEQILNDTHVFLSMDATETYRELFRTVRFWKEQDQLPAWVGRIRRGIATSTVYPDVTARLSRYHQLMQALANENALDLLQECFDSIGSKDLGLQQPPTVETYNALIQGYLMGRDTHRATAIFQEMVVAKGLQPTRSTFNILIRGYLANRDFASSQRALESLLLSDIRPDIGTFNDLMAGYFNAGQFEVGYGFYKGLSEYGVMPNATTYYYLMKSYLHRHETNKVIELFLQMKQSDNSQMHPTTRVYRLLVQALAQDGRMNDALKVLQEMRSNPGVAESANIYNVVLSQYARQRDGVRARRVLNWILQRRLTPTQGCFNPLIQLYLETGEYDLAKEMTAKMVEHGVAPSTVTYNLLIKSTKAHGQRRPKRNGEEGLQAALRLYREMARQGLEPDIWTYNILLDLMVHQLKPKTYGNSHHLNVDGSSKRRPPLELTSHEVQQHVALMEELLQSMKAAKIRPDHATYGTLIHHYVLLSNIEAAEMLFHDMIKVQGVSPNSHICNILLNGFVTTGEMDKALELFRQMPKKYGVDPTSTTLTTLIKGYCHRYDLVAAQTFARLLQEDPRLQLDQHSFHMLMHIAQRSHQPGLALDFLEMMRARGIEPDKVTYNTLINALSKNALSKRQATDAAALSRHQQRSDRRQQSARQHMGLSASSPSSSWPRVGDDPLYQHQHHHHDHDHHDSNVEATAAVEEFLDMVRQEKYPIHHTEITTILSAYFRLGRPRAAIEFFKASVRKADPKVSTSNCGALFVGLLRPEFGRRYDGAVLNLYSRMLTNTRSRLLQQGHQQQQQQIQPQEQQGAECAHEMADSLEVAAAMEEEKGVKQESMRTEEQQQRLASKLAMLRLRGVPISVIRDLMVSRPVEDQAAAMATAGHHDMEGRVSGLDSWSGYGRSLTSGESGQDLVQVLEQIAGRFGSQYYEEHVRAKEAQEEAAETGTAMASGTSSVAPPFTATTTVSTTVSTRVTAATTGVLAEMHDHSHPTVEEYNGALPNLDLVLMQTLFRAFSDRQDWSIVVQLWRDLASLPVEQLYPHEIPVEVLALASQAFYRMAAKIQAADQHRRQVEPTFTQWAAAAISTASKHGSTAATKMGEEDNDAALTGRRHGHNSSSSQQRAEQAQEYLTMSHQLLHQIWLRNPRRSHEWSMRIYGQDIFEVGTSSSLKWKQSSDRRRGGASFGRRGKRAKAKGGEASSYPQQASSH